MSWSFVANRGSTGNKTTSTTISISPSAAITVGQIAVVSFVQDNGNTTGGETNQCSCADTQSNTWTKIAEYTQTGGSLFDGAQIAMFVSEIDTQIGTGDSITVTHQNIVAKAIAVDVYTATNGFNSVADYSAGGGTSSSETISGLTSGEYLFVGMVGWEGKSTDFVSEDADYSTNAQSSFHCNDSGGPASCVSGLASYRIFTGTGDTYAPNCGSADQACILGALLESAGAGALSISESDGVTVGESLTALMSDESVSEADNITIGEVITSQLGDMVVSPSDNITIGESITATLDDLAISISDGLTLGESITVSLDDLVLSASDGLAVGESVTASVIDAGATTINVADGITIGDNITIDLRAAWYNPDSITVNVGSINSGDIEDTWSDNGVRLVLDETTGVPGFDYDFYFYDVPATAADVIINGYYDGLGAHNKKIQQYNFTTTGWTNLSPDTDDFPADTSDQDYTFRIFNDADYNNGGEIRLKLIHNTGGINTHLFFIDHFLLGTDPTVHINENITFGENLTSEIAEEINQADDIVIGDTPSLSIPAFGAVSISVSDNITITDIPRFFPDNIIIGELVQVEVVSPSVDYNISETDGITIGDSASAQLDDLIIGVADGLTIGDTPTASVPVPGAFTISETDGITIGEAITAVLDDLLVSESDGLTIGENITSSLTDLSFSTTDNIIIGDAPTASIPEVGVFTISEADSISIGDSASVTLPDALAINVTDGITIADVPNVAVGAYPPQNASTSDGLLIGEAVSISLSLGSISVADNLTAGEAVTSTMSDLTFTIADSVTVADVVSTVFFVAIIKTWTLHDRSTDWTLEDRDIDWSLNDRSTAWTLEDR